MVCTWKDIFMYSWEKKLEHLTNVVNRETSELD